MTSPQRPRAAATPDSLFMAEVEAEVERILALSDDEVLAEVGPDGVVEALATRDRILARLAVLATEEEADIPPDEREQVRRTRIEDWPGGPTELQDVYPHRRAAATPTASPEGMRDDPELPNKVLLDNQARAYKADGASGTMTMDSSVALAMIAEIMASRSAPSSDIAARQELERLTGERDAILLQAKGHAMEAQVANATIYEIYQVLSGGKGEPGNWHGAEPARAYVAAQAQRRDEVVEECARIARQVRKRLTETAFRGHLNQIDEYGASVADGIADRIEALASSSETAF